MAKIVVQNDTNPDIGIVLKYESKTLSWDGECTECGHGVSCWAQKDAIRAAQRHVDSHGGEE